MTVVMVTAMHVFVSTANSQCGQESFGTNIGPDMVQPGPMLGTEYLVVQGSCQTNRCSDYFDIELSLGDVLFLTFCQPGTGADNFDPTLSVFSSSNGAPPYFEEICVDDGGDRHCNTNSELTFIAPADGVYRVRIGDAQTNGGTYKLGYRAPATSTILPVDHCDSVFLNNIGADLLPPNGQLRAYEGSCSGQEGCNDYFDIEMSAGQTLEVYLGDRGPNDAIYNPALSVWSGSGEDAFLDEEACDASFVDSTAELTFVASRDGTYRVRLGCDNRNSPNNRPCGGDYTLKYDAPLRSLILPVSACDPVFDGELLSGSLPEAKPSKMFQADGDLHIGPQKTADAAPDGDCTGNPGCGDYFDVTLHAGEELELSFCEHGAYADFNTELSVWKMNGDLTSYELCTADSAKRSTGSTPHSTCRGGGLVETSFKALEDATYRVRVGSRDKSEPCTGPQCNGGKYGLAYRVLRDPAEQSRLGPACTVSIDTVANAPSFQSIEFELQYSFAGGDIRDRFFEGGTLESSSAATTVSCKSQAGLTAFNKIPNRKSMKAAITAMSSISTSNLALCDFDPDLVRPVLKPESDYFSVRNIEAFDELRNQVAMRPSHFVVTVECPQSCSQPFSSTATIEPMAIDCQAILQSAVGVTNPADICVRADPASNDDVPLCICNVDGSADPKATATDALRCLRLVTGIETVRDCVCAAGSDAGSK